MNEKIKEL